MKDDGKSLEIYWDNWEVWKNKKHCSRLIPRL
jgi:hypothetical protein